MADKVKATRTPKSFDSILAGVLKQPLQNRVDICKALKESIAAELKARDEQAAEAKKIAEGL